MSRLSDFFDVFLTQWNVIARQMDLIEAWNHLIIANNNSLVGCKREELIDSAKMYLKNKGLNQLLSTPMNKIEIDAPMFSGDDAARQNFHKWRNAKSNIKASSLLSFTILICMFMDKDIAYFEDFETEDGDCPINGVEFPSERIVEQICDSIGFTNKAYIDKVIAEEKFRFPFLLSSLFVFRDEQKKEGKKESLDDEENRKSVSEWLLQVFNEQIQVSNDATLSQFQLEYYETLWNECKKIYMRDIDDGKESSISKNAQISNLYIVPSFSKDGCTIEHPIDSSRRISQIMISNSGCGKSTFLQAVVTTNIYEALGILNSDLKDEIDQNAYTKLKSQLGFAQNYLPLLIKSGSINAISEEILETTPLSDLFVGCSLKDYKLHIDALLDKHDKKAELLLLVDALDEIDGSRRKEIFGRKIDAFLAEYPSANFVITTRAIDLRDFYERSFFGAAERVNINLLKDEDIYALIEKWTLCDNSLSKANQSEIEQKYKYIIENRYLASLAKNPYILSHTLWIRAHQINASPQVIISEVVGKLIKKRWPRYKYEALGINESFMREVLSYIAWEMAKTNEHYIPADNLVTALSNAARIVDDESCIDVRTWRTAAREMNSSAGLLILEDRGYVFQNKIIERYLASEWIISHYSNQVNNGLDEQEIYAMISRDFPDIRNDYWADIILMMFTPDKRYKLGRLDIITPELFRFLLLKSAETLERKELCVISEVFCGLMTELFGFCKITNKESVNGVRARAQIAHFLYNHKAIMECTEYWKESMKSQEQTAETWEESLHFCESIKFIRENNIVDNREDFQ